jgi:hypothetical protein
MPTRIQVLAGRLEPTAIFGLLGASKIGSSGTNSRSADEIVIASVGRSAIVGATLSSQPIATRGDE